jgi:hypothetical protein
MPVGDMIVCEACSGQGGYWFEDSGFYTEWAECEICLGRGWVEHENH